MKCAFVYLSRGGQSFGSGRGGPIKKGLSEPRRKNVITVLCYLSLRRRGINGSGIYALSARST